MKQLLYIVVISMSFFNCKAQKISLEERLESRLKEYIIKSRVNQSEVETKRYLENEAKFIIKARKYFFSQIKLINNKFNLIEIFDSETPSNVYTAVLKIKNKIYLFKKSISSNISLKEIELEDLKRHHKMISCMLLEMNKSKPNRLSSNIRKGSYHFTIYLTKSDINGILTYVPNDICIN